MRKYKAPGAYAHFIPTETTVQTSTPLRVMALVGTGKQFFERTNILIQRSSDSIFDKLPDSNITEIYSVSSAQTTDILNVSNKIYSHYNLKDDCIVWDSIPGKAYQPSIDVTMGVGDSAFLTDIKTSVIDTDLIVNEVYKVQISYVEKENIGTFMVIKESTGEILGDYIASTKPYTDIIPGVSLTIPTTFVLDGSSPSVRRSRTKLGDYAYIKTTTAKCHIDPEVGTVTSNESNDPAVTVTNGGSSYNIVGDGKAYISTPSKWPVITNKFSISKSYASVNFKISLYKDGVLTPIDELFSKFMVNIDGVIEGVTGVSKSQLIYDSAMTGSLPQTNYNITSVITTASSLVAGDDFELGYSYILKDNITIDQSDFIIHLDIIDIAATPTSEIVSMDNIIFVRNDVIPHTVDSSNTIFASLIKDIKIINSSNVKSANYKIKINDITKNEIVIYDVTNNVTLGTYRTDINAEFAEAIPGIQFTLYSFDDIEGLLAMYNTKDIYDTTGATVYISTLAGITNPEVPENDSYYYVSYKYAKAEEDYNPKIFYDYDQILSEYGAYTVTASGTILNSLSLGAEIAFTNGANPIVCVQAKNDTDIEINNAIDKLAYRIGSLNNINSIVPLTTSKTVGKYLSNHVTNYSSSEHNLPRMGYLAAELNEVISKSYTINDVKVGSIQAAKTYNNERIVYVVPGKVSKTVTDPYTGYNVTRTLPGCYLSVACAAIGMKNDPAEPLTNKEILGFDKVLTQFSEPDMNQLAMAGCLVVKQDGNRIKIRHGITTHGEIQTLADIQSNEITLVQIKDYVIEGARVKLGDLYIGGKMKTTILSDVEYTLEQLFSSYVANDIIIGVDGLTVKRDTSDPRQINVKFFIEAVYPLNFIDISFGFSTTIS